MFHRIPRLQPLQNHGKGQREVDATDPLTRIGGGTSSLHADARPTREKPLTETSKQCSGRISGIWKTRRHDYSMSRCGAPATKFLGQLYKS